MARGTPDTRLADSGTLLATTHRLDGGASVRLRLTRPSDRRGVREFLERLAPETRQRRFLSPMPRVPEAVIDHFTFYDPRQRLVIAATTPGENGREEVIGLGDVSLDATTVAELGLVVEEEHQSRGIGSLLAEAIASLALSRGATHLKAEMLDSSPVVMRLLASIGPTMRTTEDGHAVVYAKLPARARWAA
ncbi:MAG TPA: GNAT family N-acetyltransferase [Thermoleophilaceae bacterium]|nr:GNAT family N-acetyltransferase [Thermoleophilaceae bacterium]